MDSLIPVLSATPPNANEGFNHSWVGVNNEINRKLYAQVVYSINSSDTNYNNTQTPKMLNIHKESTCILKEDTSRKLLFIQNIGKGSVFVYFGEQPISLPQTKGNDPVECTCSFILSPNEKVSDSLYQGPVTISSFDGSTVLYWQA
jgi:hypothetical protein